MKILKFITLLVLLSFTGLVFAHCPAAYKEEKVCFMLDKNVIYIYDHKLEHNGPYKDFEKASISSIKTLKGEKLEYKKLARGIYKIESPADQRNLILELMINKNKKEIKLSHE